MSEVKNMPLRVVSSGVCCSVGNNAPATCAAIRARLNHFRETDFLDDAGEPVNAAELFDVPVWGEQRLQYMYRTAMTECLEGLEGGPNLETDSLPPIILIGAERDRGERFKRSIDKLLRNNRPSGGYDEDTYQMHLGKAGIVNALRMASIIFSTPKPPEYVIVVGVDSFLDAPTIDRYLRAQRLKCSTNADGFIPGEAGAAIALSAKPGKEPSLWIEGVGHGQEEASPEGDVPLRAVGLTNALRAAMEDAGAQSSDFLFHASGVSGEQWYFNEAALAMDRVMTHKAEAFPHRLVSQSVGEIGAACGPLALAWIGSEMAVGDLGHRGLLHFANDDGARSALAVHFRK